MKMAQCLGIKQVHCLHMCLSILRSSSLLILFKVVYIFLYQPVFNPVWSVLPFTSSVDIVTWECKEVRFGVVFIFMRLYSYDVNFAEVIFILGFSLHLVIFYSAFLWALSILRMPFKVFSFVLYKYHVVFVCRFFKTIWKNKEDHISCNPDVISLIYPQH